MKSLAPQLPAERVLEIVAENRVPRQRFPVAVVAIRGYRLDSLGKPGANDRDIFDDALFIVLPDGRVLPFNGNTDPAGWKHGRATLCPGIHLMGPGPHNVSKGTSRMYPAFRQAEVFTVTRDGRGAERFTGFFGINLHKASGRFGSFGTTSSHGCQTLPTDPGPLGWSVFQPTLTALLRQHGNETGPIDLGLWDPGKWQDVPLFPYLLVDETERRKGNLIVSKRFLKD
jgi:hypothetical protein